MPLDTHHYTNDEVTVVWKPNVCIHSTLCWKGLLQVFDPRARPWVNMQGASTDRIIEQVRKCPSGALSYFLNAKGGDDPARVIAESAGITKIEVTPDGPYTIRTECVIVHCDGTEEMKAGTVSLCRCGASNNKPFCDGTHTAIGFKG